MMGGGLFCEKDVILLEEIDTQIKNNTAINYTN